MVAVIALGRIRNHKAFLRKIKIVDFDAVQERLSRFQNDVDLFICGYDDIIFLRRIQIQTVVGMIAMRMGYQYANFLVLVLFLVQLSLTP